MELEELRNRLLLRAKSAEKSPEIPPVPEPISIPEVPVIHPPEKSADAEAKLNGATMTAPATKLSLNGNSESISLLTKAVDQLFEPTQAFRAHFSLLTKVLQPMESASLSTLEAFERISGLYDHLATLSKTFQSVKQFAEQVGELATSFEPMRALHSQLTELIGAFYVNLRELAIAFEPVKELQVKVRHLGNALESIGRLEGQLLLLADAFKPTPAVEDTAASPTEAKAA